MPAEIDFSKGVRGKFASRFAGVSFVTLDPDVAAVFRTSEAVNAALRTLARAPKASRRSARRKAS